MSKQNLLVIGNGMAGLRFLECMMAKTPDSYNITVIGGEPEPAYNRVLLSAVLAGEAERESIILKDRNWYRANRIRLQTDSQAEKLDLEKKSVSLASGEKIHWDKLVLATGSNPIQLPLPGADLKGVMTFRSFRDVSQMEEIAADKKNAVVIGGGLLGLETAYGLNKLGMQVTLLHLMDRLMERQLDEYAAGILKEKIEAQGITVKLNADTECLEGDANLASVKLKSGEAIPADLCVMAVGVKPEISLAATAAGLKCERGIVVNNRMQTSNPNVFAVGECAQHDGVAYGLVEPLYEQAEVLADFLNGDEAVGYTGSSISTNLKVSGVEVFSAGEFMTVPELEPLIYQDGSGGIYKKLLIKHCADGKQVLAGSVIVGDRSDGPWYRDLIRNETPVQNMRDALIFGRDIAELAA